VRWIALLLALLLVTTARADDLRPGYLEFTETAPGKWQMTWKAPILGGLAAGATPIVPAGCMRDTERRETRDAALLSVSLLRCEGDLAGKRIGVAGMDTLFTDALVRIAPLGQPVQAARLTPETPTVVVAERPERGSVARTYFRLGVEHIVFGFDHLLFVAALVLLLRGVWRVAATVTAFTLAHSVTLVATTLGLVSVPRAPVESVIALSILFLAVEIVKARPSELRLSERHPWTVAFLFGLLHGFGFAGALAEIGLPEGEVPTALLTFNLGVEAGQLGIVAAVALLLAAIRWAAPPALRPAQVAAAYAIGGTAGFWFIERTLA
jgi:hydrogenase/urease accessory protein HupE